MGHDIRVTRGFDRLHEMAVELSEISRRFTAVDNREADRFAERKLDEHELSSRYISLTNSMFECRSLNNILTLFRGSTISVLHTGYYY